jgi:hypothetical protein
MQKNRPLPHPQSRGGGGLQVNIYVRVFEMLLRLYFQWELERTNPTPTGKKTARMVFY